MKNNDCVAQEIQSCLMEGFWLKEKKCQISEYAIAKNHLFNFRNYYLKRRMQYEKDRSFPTISD